MLEWEEEILMDILFIEVGLGFVGDVFWNFFLLESLFWDKEFGVLVICCKGDVGCGVVVIVV